MTIRVDDELAEYMAQSSGAIHFELRGADEKVALRGLRQAKQSILRVPHPEEPSDPFAPFASDVAPGPNGPGFWVDMADAEAYDGILEEALGRVLAALVQSGVTEGCLTWPQGTCETTTAWAGA